MSNFRICIELLYGSEYMKLTLGCLYECLWSLAQRECNCIPWNQPNDQHSNICIGKGNACFKGFLENGNNLKMCQCQPDCSSIEYKFYIKKEKLKPQEICQDKTSNPVYEKIYSYLNNFVFDNRMMKFFAMIESIEHGIPFDPYTFVYPSDGSCLDRVANDIAIVEVFFGDLFAKQSELNIRCQFHQHLKSSFHIIENKHTDFLY
jgi:hypothetical protein